MIEFKKLRKVYKSRKGGNCVALKDIDLKLPDSGLVFIIGKSGSGKSTLLNLLGGLDTITGGDIIADGNSVASFSKKDFENYRSSYIGFVFQHYYLLEELTVRQNVELAMDIVGGEDSSKVDALLRKVGLEGYGDRYPKELSGGQQQRVAIARALVKDPKLILGDELTGNLDHRTSADIMKVLKEISKERLVIVVSHNLDEADQFADRIIELHDGKIFRDRSRITNCQKEFTIKGDTAYLPYFRDLNPKEVKVLELGLRTGNIRDVVQRDDGFVMSTTPKDSKRTIQLHPSRFTNKKRNRYAAIFTKKGLLSKLITIVVVTLVMLIGSVFTSMHKIQHSEIPYQKGESYVSLFKGGLENTTNGLFSSYYYRVLDSEISRAESISGEKVYRLVNMTLTTSPNAPSSTAGSTQSDIRRNLDGFYLIETYGTLICDEQLLIDKYGVDGKLVFVDGTTGDPYKFTRGTMVITDYVADAMMKFQPDRYPTYQSIIDSERALAIVETGYKERYAEIIKAYDNYTGDDEYESLFYQLCDTPLFEEFLNELIYSLGITYSFDPNFSNDYINNPLITLGSVTVRFVSFETDKGVYPETNRTAVSVACTTSEVSITGDITKVNAGEIRMNYATYNQIFETGYTLENYKTDFEPHDVVMKVYDTSSGDGTVVYEMKMRIVGLLQISNTIIHRSEFDNLKQLHVQTIGMYVKNNENVDEVISALSDSYIAPRTIAFEAVTGINKILTVFIPLLKLISYGLYIFVMVFLINHAMQTIKKNYFQIGVFRSFGAKNSDVGIIFITGVVLTGMAISVLSVALSGVIVEMYNSILVTSFATVLNTKAFDIRVINMPAWLPIVNAALVMVTTVASAVISLLVLRNLKPIEIIRAKDNGGEV